MSTILPSDSVARSAQHQQVIDAWRRALRNVKQFPHPRWRFDDMFRGDRRTGMHTVLSMIDALIEAKAPKADVLEIVDALERYIDSSYPQHQNPSLRLAVRQETEAEGEANVAEMDAVCDPTPVNLDRAERAILRHERTSITVVHAIRDAKGRSSWVGRVTRRPA